MGVRVTGNHEVDSATAEIAVVLRDGNPGGRDQHYYDMAAELRDRIMAGTRELDASQPPATELLPWRPAVNGTSKRPWFLIRGWGLEADRIPLADRYHNGPAGSLVRYASPETAQVAADKLNGAELNLTAYLDAKHAYERSVAEWGQAGGHGDVPADVRAAEHRVDAIKRAAGPAGPGEPLCCRSYSRLHEPAFSLPGCRWYQQGT